MSFYKGYKGCKTVLQAQLIEHDPPPLPLLARCLRDLLCQTQTSQSHPPKMIPQNCRVYITGGAVPPGSFCGSQHVAVLHALAVGGVPLGGVCCPHRGRVRPAVVRVRPPRLRPCAPLLPRYAGLLHNRTQALAAMRLQMREHTQPCVVDDYMQQMPRHNRNAGTLKLDESGEGKGE